MRRKAHYQPTELPESLNREYLEQLLNNISKNNSQLDAPSWLVGGAGDACFTFDILPIQNLCDKHPIWAQRLEIDPCWLAKIIFLHINQGRSTISSFRNTYQTICKTFIFLATRKQDHGFTVVDLLMYLEFTLMHSFTNGVLQKRLKIPTYGPFMQSMIIHKWPQILKRIGLPNIGFGTIFSEKKIKEEIAFSIDLLSYGELTYRDWVEGGSLNKLTLDYGQYYIEHCAEFFESNVALAISIQTTMNKTANIAEMAGLKYNKRYLKGQIVPIINHILLGKQISELPPTYYRDNTLNELKSIEQATLKIFGNTFRTLRVCEIILSDIEVDKFAVELGISSPSLDYRHWLRLLIEVRLNIFEPDYFQETDLTLALEADWIVNYRANDIDISKLDISIYETLQRLRIELDCTLPKSEFYMALGLNTGQSSRSTYLHKFLRLVADSGLTQFVAISGWRASEFGFSLNDVAVTRNHDTLDQKSYPWRYEVQFFVPKTNGTTKLRREITRTAYRLVQTLAQLNQAGREKRCLYVSSTQADFKDDASAAIKNRVSSMWVHFVNNYRHFIQLEQLDTHHALQAENSTLTQKYWQIDMDDNLDTLNKDRLLREAYSKARKELPRAQFFIDKDGRRGLTWAYCNGTLSSEYTALLDNYLSPETKIEIRSFTNKAQITNDFTRAVVSEIMDDVLYPTPHAFRHMWAEAVYRRFDGDAGWMIRSSFKHISQNMWLEYVRNKDHRRQHDQVKRQVISTLLTNYVHKKGQGYSGAMDKMLRRLFLRTRVVDIEQLDKTIEKFSQTEIVDIKSNPWGYCLLRKRNQFRAKCSEGGEPQRHNACVNLCLSCSNNLTQNGNIEGILLNISNDLKVLCSPSVPEPYYRVSYETVHAALRHLQKLNADKDVLLELQDTLNARGQGTRS